MSIVKRSAVSCTVSGAATDEALEIRNTDIVNELALPPVKIHCSVLAEDAIRAAVADLKRKQGGGNTEATAGAEAGTGT